MKICGYLGTTLIDYPNKLSSMIFTGGCNFNCPFCHNKEVVKNLSKEILKDQLFSKIKEREGFVDALVISGGEPLINGDLKDFIKEVKARFKLKIKLDTNGLLSEKLAELLEEDILDYVAMDIKSAPYNYSKASGVDVDYKKIKESIVLINNSKIDSEYRTTVVPGLIEKEDIKIITQEIKRGRKLILQQFNNENTLNENYVKITPYSEEELEEIAKEGKKYFSNIFIKIFN